MFSQQYLGFLGVFITIAAFAIGKWIFAKSKHFPLLNPTLVAIALVVFTLWFFKIDYAVYNVGGNFFTLLLLPATAVLALPIYNNRKLIKENFVPIMVGCLVGAITALVSVYALSKLFNLSPLLINSTLGKSVTAPIGIEFTKMLGGEPSIVLIGINIAGISGTIIAPFFTKIFKMKNPVAIGIATGTCSHVMGTTKAMEMGEDIGAMSSVAIGIVGVFTIILAALLI